MEASSHTNRDIHGGDDDRQTDRETRQAGIHVDKGRDGGRTLSTQDTVVHIEL